MNPGFIHAQTDAFAKATILLLQLEINFDAICIAPAPGSHYGLLRILNPAPVHLELDGALLSQCDIITPNETEFALLCERINGHCIAAATLTSCTDAKLHALARQLHVPTVIITLGSQGCFASYNEHVNNGDAQQSFYRLGSEPVHAIDTTGAGDAFNGALVAALLRLSERPFRDAIIHANRATALSTEIISTARHRNAMVGKCHSTMGLTDRADG